MAEDQLREVAAQIPRGNMLASESASGSMRFDKVERLLADAMRMAIRAAWKIGHYEGIEAIESYTNRVLYEVMAERIKGGL